MRCWTPILALLSILALPGPALAWGPLTHAAHFHELEAGGMAPDDLALVRRHQGAFQLGANMPDIRQIARLHGKPRLTALARRIGWQDPRWVPLGIDTHSPFIALDLIRAARSLHASDPDRGPAVAFALGWLAHVTGDAVAQSTYTAKKMCEHGLPGMNTCEDLVEASADRRIIERGYVSEAGVGPFDVRTELHAASASVSPALVALVHGVISSPRWHSGISQADLTNLCEGYRIFLHYYTGRNVLSRAVGAASLVLDRVLGPINRLPPFGALIPDLLLARTYRDLPFAVVTGCAASTRIVAALDTGSLGSEPWLRWTTINLYALRFGGQQWYNRLAPGRHRNRDGLVVWDFAFRRAGSGERLDHGRPEVGEGAGVEAWIDLAAWQPVDHDIRVRVRRDIARWFDRDVTSVSQRIHLDRNAILGGERREVRVPLRFTRNRWRWGSRRRGRTQGFYVVTHLNAGRFRGPEWTTKDSRVTRRLHDDRTYDRWPFSLAIDPSHPTVHSARPGGYSLAGRGNVAVPRWIDRLPAGV